MNQKTQSRLWIHGVTGRMGQLIVQLLKEPPYQAVYDFVGGSSRHFLFSDDLTKREENIPERFEKRLTQTDVLIDFSLADGNSALRKTLRTAAKENLALLIGTTGLDPKSLSEWKDLAIAKHHKLLFAPNTSIGVVLLIEHANRLACELSGRGFDLEIIETHHRHKKDAPSGTAKLILESMQKALANEGKAMNTHPIHSLRAGGVIGEHCLRFISDEEEITLSHKALSRNLFAKGALQLAQWLAQQKPGVYSLKDVRLS